MSKFKPEYDIDVINLALSMGWRHEDLYGDLGSHIAVVKRLQREKGLSWDKACETYRAFVAQQVEEFFNDNLGRRTG